MSEPALVTQPPQQITSGIPILPTCNVSENNIQYYDNDFSKTAGTALGGGSQMSSFSSSFVLFAIITALKRHLILNTMVKRSPPA